MRLGGSIGPDHVEVGDVRHQLARFRIHAASGLEVGADTVAKGLRLAYVDYDPIGVLHQVNAGSCSQCGKSGGKVGASVHHNTAEYTAVRSEHAAKIKRLRVIECVVLAAS